MISLVADGGGTRTRIWIVRNDTRACLLQFEKGPSNLGQVGEEGLRVLCREVQDEIGSELAPEALVLGLAGVGREPERKRALRVAQDCFPRAEVHVVTDAELAYSAAFADGRHGVMIIAGTGTIGCFRTLIGHEFMRVGGWGPTLGDEGGGAWIGREALRHCLAEWERDELSPLHACILRDLQIDTATQILTRVYHEKYGPREWAKLAPLVFQCAKEDSGAQRILKSAAIELVSLAERIAEKQLPEAHDIPLVITGGLWQQKEVLQPLMEEEIALRNLPFVFSEPAAGTMEGGLLLLEELRGQ